MLYAEEASKKVSDHPTAHRAYQEFNFFLSKMPFRLCPARVP